ncbi:M20/M25/M40 family metallo-hydrolase [Flavobacterium sp. Sd200]|uniref:M20/M25/M40 family metallo-hydrolase n=1 Tax=Flavobacterium sp. Sd200 TaxID=2692211 RepID=UPI00136BBC7A|nr:M20/M25/M40 family metallo-hydrolase [Flavobacterium sp. Sd200]MXN90886.1 M20/M25/M40 family metallo-hydrolase [Flavobacterium sp. Sd200]
MKKIFLLFFIAGFFSAYAQKKTTAATYKVEEKSVSETLKFLSSDALKGRLAGSRGLETAAQYLEDVFEKNGVKPYFISYKDTLTNFDKPTYNVVGYLEGTDPKLKKEFVVFGAHYDHIGTEKNPVATDSIYNGANDDASGVTTVAELVNYFGKTKSNKRSIMFCFFSAEEAGLLGSQSLAAKLKAQNFNLYAMLNFEMVGVAMKRDILAYLTGYGMTTMGEKINEYAGKKLVGYLDVEMKYQLFRRSDNFSFYNEFKKPAQTICTFDFENFAYYHKVEDDFEHMDTKHMTSFIQQMIPVTDKMVNAPAGDIVMKK